MLVKKLLLMKKIIGPFKFGYNFEGNILYRPSHMKSEGEMRVLFLNLKFSSDENN